MALVGDTFYVGNTDGVVAFPYAAGADRITAPGRKLVDVQARRPLDAQPAAEPRRHASSMSASARSATSPTTAWRPRKAAPRSTSSTSPPARSRIFASRPAQPGGPGLGADDRRALDRGQRARRPRRRDAARLPDLGARRRLLRLALLLLGPDGGRPRAAGPGPGRQGASRPTTRWAATPPRSACAGCRPARCRASPTAWSSASTARGTAARSAATRWSSCRSRTAGPSGPPRDILSGFLAPDEKVSYGRPVGVTLGPDGVAAGGRRCRRRDLARDGGVGACAEATSQEAKGTPQDIVRSWRHRRWSRGRFPQSQPLREICLRQGSQVQGSLRRPSASDRDFWRA